LAVVAQPCAPVVSHMSGNALRAGLLPHGAAGRLALPVTRAGVRRLRDAALPAPVPVPRP